MNTKDSVSSPALFMKLLITLLLSLPLFSQEYDLLLKGGQVLDAKNQIHAVRDVAIKDGKIAAVSEHIDAAQAKTTIDAKGLYVTPGLVDIHVHVYAARANGTHTREI